MVTVLNCSLTQWLHIFQTFPPTHPLQMYIAGAAARREGQAREGKPDPASAFRGGMYCPALSMELRGNQKLTKIVRKMFSLTKLTVHVAV